MGVSVPSLLMHLSMSSPTTPRAGNVGGFVGEFHQRTPRGGTGLVIRTFRDLRACAHAYIPVDDSEEHSTD